MTLLDRWKSLGKLGIPKSDDPLDWCGWPLAVPTVNVGSVRSNFIVGAFLRSRIHWHQSLKLQCVCCGCVSLLTLRGGSYG